MIKNGYCGNDGFIFACDLGVSFFRHPKLGGQWFFGKFFWS